MKFTLRNTLAGLAMILSASAAQAMQKDAFQEIAQHTIKTVLSGSVADIDGLIAQQTKLVELGVEGCREYAASTSDPVHKKIMALVVRDADKMMGMSLDEIEEAWHEGGVLSENGIDMDDLGQSSAVISLMDTVVHPATAFIALNQYKTSKDSDLLDQVKDELAEVLHHLEQIN
ncbi:MAG: hypothetical protein QF491_03965 [Alphaproteobacteria bacterium]|nr:hypothetical protein [Alphaproteobacteria bacterium]